MSQTLLVILAVPLGLIAGGFATMLQQHLRLFAHQRIAACAWLQQDVT